MVENIMGEGENAGYQRFLLFPQCFQKASYTELLKVGIVWYKINSVSASFLTKLSLQGLINPFLNKPWFLRVCSRSPLKTLWEKEKLLITSNFSISHSDFYPFGELSAIVIKFEIVVCKISQFGRV